MITRNQLDQIVKSLPKTLSSDEWRTAASVATGAHHDKSLLETIKFYSLNKDLAMFWWEKFDLKSEKPLEVIAKKSKPKKALTDFVKINIGSSITAQTLADKCSVSLPTVYSFITSNRGWFKKTGRGLYEIIDSDKEREKVKK
jgi:hypothetical protein